MNSFPSALSRLMASCVALFLFFGLVATAQQASSDEPKNEIQKAGVDGTSMPECQYCPAPGYSQEARNKKYQGVVVLLDVITPDGKARDIRVLKSPGMGLDDKAVEAVRKWRFKPAKKDGKHVPVQVPVEVTFRLN